MLFRLSDMANIYFALKISYQIVATYADFAYGILGTIKKDYFGS